MISNIVSEDFPSMAVFCLKARKCNSGFVILLEKYAKIMHFWDFLMKFLLKIFDVFPSRKNPGYAQGWELITKYVFQIAPLHHIAEFPHIQVLSFRKASDSNLGSNSLYKMVVSILFS